MLEKSKFVKIFLIRSEFELFSHFSKLKFIAFDHFHLRKILMYVITPLNVVWSLTLIYLNKRQTKMNSLYRSIEDFNNTYQQVTN